MTKKPAGVYAVRSRRSRIISKFARLVLPGRVTTTMLSTSRTNRSASEISPMGAVSITT